MKASMKKERKKSVRGFTLIEIMIVLAIIGIIFSFVGVNVMSQFKDAKVKAAKIQIANYEQALQAYYLAHNFYPSTEQGLEALIRKPTVGRVPENWTGNYFKKKELVPDPWDHPYQYKCDDQQNYVIYSNGPDGSPGTEDDISSEAL